MEVFDRDDAREAESLGEVRSETASTFSLRLQPVVPPQPASETAWVCRARPQRMA